MASSPFFLSEESLSKQIGTALDQIYIRTQHEDYEHLFKEYQEVEERFLRACGISRFSRWS